MAGADGRSVALAVTASILASSALAGCDSSASRGAAQIAPNCPPAVTSPREASWDPEGCWETRPDGGRSFRTAWGGHYYYYPSPPAYSRYASESSSSSSKWFSGWQSSGAHAGG